MQFFTWRNDLLQWISVQSFWPHIKHIKYSFTSFLHIQHSLKIYFSKKSKISEKNSDDDSYKEDKSDSSFSSDDSLYYEAELEDEEQRYKRIKKRKIRWIKSIRNKLH